MSSTAATAVSYVWAHACFGRHGDQSFRAGWAFFLGRATVLKARSKSFGLSEAPTSFAIAMKRAWRWASVSLGLADLRGIIQ